MRSGPRSLALWLALAAIATSAAEAPADPAPGRIDERLRSRLAEARADEPIRVQIVLRERDLPRVGRARRDRIRSRQDRALGALPAGSFALRRRYGELSGLAGSARPAAIAALEGHPEVERVYLDMEIETALVEGAAMLGSDQVLAQGFTGAGVNVAVLDTGVDTDHVHLVDDLVAEQCYCGSPGSGCCPGGVHELSGPGSAEDDDGHGTGMAGVITSSKGTSPGVAPDAGIVAVRVLSSSGTGATSDLDAGLDWVLANHAALGIRVVNMSLSDAGQYQNGGASPCTGSLTQIAVTNLVAAGVAVFAASGNHGYDAGIGYPACIPDVISVGAVYDAYFSTAQWCLGTACTQTCTDTPALSGGFVCHTNAGVLLDVLAPSWKARTLDLGGGNVNLAGTSVASAYASGEAALLLGADPGLTPAEIRSLLTSNATLVQNPGSGLGYPRTNLFAAYQDVLLTLDSDADGILDDGDGSGSIGDDPCAGGQTVACDDNCPETPNALQADADSDAAGDVCDACPNDPLDDADLDGLCANADNCPAVANPLQGDGDLDGSGDACDACPADPLNDADADGLCANADNCAADWNPGQEDFDLDGVGDACEVIRTPALGGGPTGLLALLLVATGLRGLRGGSARGSVRGSRAPC